VRGGIGSQIMQQCEVAAGNAGFKTIEIVATLTYEPLYKAFGYKITEQLDIPLANGEILPVVRIFKGFIDAESANFKQSIIAISEM
jgi:predicted N-acetyltransferase YhbS